MGLPPNDPLRASPPAERRELAKEASSVTLETLRALVRLEETRETGHLDDAEYREKRDGILRGEFESSSAP